MEGRSKIWAVLSDEQMSNGYPFSLLNDEQMSNKVRVEHQPEIHSDVLSFKFHVMFVVEVKGTCVLIGCCQTLFTKMNLQLGYNSCNCSSRKAGIF